MPFHGQWLLNPHQVIMKRCLRPCVCNHKSCLWLLAQGTCSMQMTYKQVLDNKWTKMWAFKMCGSQCERLHFIQDLDKFYFDKIWELTTIVVSKIIGHAKPTSKVHVMIGCSSKLTQSNNCSTSYVHKTWQHYNVQYFHMELK